MPLKWDIAVYRRRERETERERERLRSLFCWVISHKYGDSDIKELP
jgi:hypothetical protein